MDSLLRVCSWEKVGVVLAAALCFGSVGAAEVTLTANSDATIDDQLAAEGKTLSDGDTLVKAGTGTLTMNQQKGALLAGGTVKAGMLAVNPAAGLGKVGAAWTVEDGGTIRIGGMGSYNTNLKFHLSGTGFNGAGALAVYDSSYQTCNVCDFMLDADALMSICSDSSYTGLFSNGRLHFNGHTLTIRGIASTSTIRQRLGGTVNGGGTLLLDSVQYTSGGLADSNFSHDDGVRTMKLVNGSSFRVNIQKQFDAYATFDGAAGTTLRTDSGTLAAATFQNLTGSPTLDASLESVTVNGLITVRGGDLAAGKCLDCQQPVMLGNGAAVDLTDGDAIETNREYVIATASGGFVGSLPRVAGEAYRRRATLRFSDDRKTLYATFGTPDVRDFGAVSAWYRFDDASIGTVLGHGAVVVNEVDPSLGQGTVQLLDATSVAQTGIAPVVAQPSELTEVYDPLTGVTFQNKGSLECRTAVISGTSTKGANIRIFGDRSNMPTNSVTLEAFVCSTGGVYNLMAPIVSLTGGHGTTGEALSLLVNSTGCVCFRFWTRDMPTASIWGHTSTTGKRLFDGRWHHVALVYDAETGKAKIYVDYQQDYSDIAIGPGGLTYVSNVPVNTVYIGGYDTPDGRKFNGRIDEVRIVGAALAPEHFLQRRRSANLVASLTTANTLFFAPMAPGVTGEGSLENVNFATNTPDATVNRFSAGSLFFSTNSPTSGVRASHRHATSMATGALTVGGAANATGTVVIQNGYTNYFADSFTLEGSFRTTNTLDSSTIVCLDHQDNYTLKLMINEGNRFYIAANSPNWWGCYVATNSVCDGKWHLFRFVYDHEVPSFKVILDDTVTYTMTTSIGTISKATRLVIGGQKSGNADLIQSFTGDIGPIRISRGKLEPQEWLSEVDPAEADPTMRDGVAFHLRGLTAEGLLDVAPYPSSRTPGETAVMQVVGAAAPSFTPDVRFPSLCLYGVADGLVATNTGAIHLQNSALIFCGQRALDTSPQTIEMLARFESIGSGARLFRLGMTEGNAAESVTDRIIAFIENGYVRFGITTDDDGSKGDAYVNSTILASELIGGWHHLAISWDEDIESGTTTIRTYLDYKLRDEETRSFKIWHSKVLTSHSLVIGHSNPITSEGLVGDIDEFRITAGVLQPESFIRRTPRPPSGMTILLR